MEGLRLNILWDFDGTLFNTYPAYTTIFKGILNKNVTENEILSHLKISFTHAIKQYKLTKDQISEIFEKEKCLSPDLTPPFSNVEEILRLAEKNVIMTHKPRKEVVNILEFYGWEAYFVDMIAGDDGFPRKPDPVSYLHLHNKYRIDLVIGDREIDILPAKVIGIKTCLFQNDTPGADFYLSNYQDFTLVCQSVI